MSIHPVNRRRRQIIKPRFQWRFLRNILLLEGLAFGAAVLMTLAADHLLFNPALAAGAYWRWLSAGLVAGFVAIGGWLFWLGLRLSNRISGPIYRVEKILETVAEGRLPESCCFRDRDEHPELADAVNRMLITLRQRMPG